MNIVRADFNSAFQRFDDAPPYSVVVETRHLAASFGIDIGLTNDVRRHETRIIDTIALTQSRLRDRGHQGRMAVRSADDPKPRVEQRAQITRFLWNLKCPVFDGQKLARKFKASAKAKASFVLNLKFVGLRKLCLRGPAFIMLRFSSMFGRGFFVFFSGLRFFAFLRRMLMGFWRNLC